MNTITVGMKYLSFACCFIGILRANLLGDLMYIIGLNLAIVMLRKLITYKLHVNDINDASIHTIQKDNETRNTINLSSFLCKELLLGVNGLCKKFLRVWERANVISILFYRCYTNMIFVGCS